MRQNLYYRLSKLKNANDSTLLGVTIATTSSETQGVISDITGDEALQQTIVTNSVIDVSSNIGGRKKGTTKEKKEEATQNQKK